MSNLFDNLPEKLKENKVLVGAIALVSLGGLGFYFYKNKQIPSNDSELSIEQRSQLLLQSVSLNENGEVDLTKITVDQAKKLYLLFLKDQYKTFQPYIDELEQVCKLIKQNAINKGQNPTAEDLRLTILGQPQIMGKLQEFEDEVYKRHKLNKADFSEYVKQHFQNYEEANKYLTKTASLIAAATSGENLAKLTEVPQNLTPQKTFLITQKCMMVSNVQFQKELLNIIAKKGKIDYQDEETRKTLNLIDIAKLRQKIFEEEGIQNFEDPPQRILRAAVTKYMEQADESFAKKLQELEERHQNCYESLIKNPDKIIDFKKIYNLSYN